MLCGETVRVVLCGESVYVMRCGESMALCREMGCVREGKGLSGQHAWWAGCTAESAYIPAHQRVSFTAHTSTNLGPLAQHCKWGQTKWGKLKQTRLRGLERTGLSCTMAQFRSILASPTPPFTDKHLVLPGYPLSGLLKACVVREFRAGFCSSRRARHAQLARFAVGSAMPQ